MRVPFHHGHLLSKLLDSLFGVFRSHLRPRVLIFSYERDGSSLVADLPRTSYWYESATETKDADTHEKGEPGDAVQP
jgi:hypothetical protein